METFSYSERDRKTRLANEGRRGDNPNSGIGAEVMSRTDKLVSLASFPRSHSRRFTRKTGVLW
ncbi:MAG: hypothetical protein ACK5YO_09185, partial [Planctomyces sp.]